MKENWIFALFAISGALLMDATHRAIGTVTSLSMAIGYHILFVIGLVFVLLRVGKLIYEFNTRKK